VSGTKLSLKKARLLSPNSKLNLCLDLMWQNKRGELALAKERPQINATATSTLQKLPLLLTTYINMVLLPGGKTVLDVIKDEDNNKLMQAAVSSAGLPALDGKFVANQKGEAVPADKQGRSKTASWKHHKFARKYIVFGSAMKDTTEMATTGAIDDCLPVPPAGGWGTASNTTLKKALGTLASPMLSVSGMPMEHLSQAVGRQILYQAYDDMKTGRLGFVGDTKATCQSYPAVTKTLLMEAYQQHVNPNLYYHVEVGSYDRFRYTCV